MIYVLTASFVILAILFTAYQLWSKAGQRQYDKVQVNSARELGERDEIGIRWRQCWGDIVQECEDVDELKERFNEDARIGDWQDSGHQSFLQNLSACDILIAPETESWVHAYIWADLRHHDRNHIVSTAMLYKFLDDRRRLGPDNVHSFLYSVNDRHNDDDGDGPKTSMDSNSWFEHMCQITAVFVPVLSKNLLGRRRMNEQQANADSEDVPSELDRLSSLESSYICEVPRKQVPQRVVPVYLTKADADEAPNPFHDIQAFHLYNKQGMRNFFAAVCPTRTVSETAL